MPNGTIEDLEAGIRKRLKRAKAFLVFAVAFMLFCAITFAMDVAKYVYADGPQWLCWLALAAVLISTVDVYAGVSQIVRVVRLEKDAEIAQIRNEYLHDLRRFNTVIRSMRGSAAPTTEE